MSSVRLVSAHFNKSGIKTINDEDISVKKFFFHSRLADSGRPRNFTNEKFSNSQSCTHAGLPTLGIRLTFHENNP